MANPTKREARVTPNPVQEQLKNTGKYTIELDLHLVFDPPMSEDSEGIVMTRRFELPFVPHSDMAIYSKHWDTDPNPMGFILKDVTWDMDRAVFLATTYVVSSDMPLGSLPDELLIWLSHGWRLGSWIEHYSKAIKDNESAQWDRSKSWLDPGERDKADVLHRLPPIQRSKKFNDFVKAIVRCVAETYQDWATAYAMAKTGLLITSKDTDLDKTIRDNWQRFTKDFERMSGEDQLRWVERTKKYPTLKRLFAPAR